MGFLDTVKSAKAKVQAAAKAVKATDASDATPNAPSAADDYTPLKPTNATILALDIVGEKPFMSKREASQRRFCKWL